jgi:hypothetical protein
MDDFYGWDFADDLVYFREKLRPRRQVQLLLFWDSINCPYEDDKQLSSNPLKIIGFWIDIDAGSISLSPESITNIQHKIREFLDTPSRKPALRDWLRLGGHLNWLLNVLPWGRPALTELYRKISGKVHMYQGIFINAEVRRDLEWLMDIIPQSIGVHFTDTGLWADIDADMVFWTDASRYIALSFVFAGNGFVYQISSEPTGPPIDIFFLELVAILSAIHYAASLASPPRRLLIWSDSLDAVAIFNSLRTSQSLHNGVLLGVASIILQSGIDLRVRHIAGKDNVRADMLSRLLLTEFASQFPAYRVRPFDPPRDLLPTRWRKTF